MKIRNINKTIFEKNYSTENIIQVVLKAYEIEDDSQISDLAQELKGNDDTETCRNIWQYLIDNIRYIADGADQDIKSPARLVHDGTGDCKSYSLFTACILRELGIKHFFRFVSYNKRKEATHVYCVALIDNTELPIDAVAYVQARVPFGEELEYKFRADMAEKIGRIRYLAGIGKQRHSIGAMPTAEAIQEYLNSDAFTMWTDNESESDLTMAKGYLLSEYDKYWTIAAYASTTNECIEALNRLQYICAMLRTYKELRNDNELLTRAGRAFAYLIKNAIFDTNEADPKDRIFFSDVENREVRRLIANSDQLPDSEFTATWNQYVVAANRPYLDENGEVASIGSVNEVRTNLKKTGGYYIYSLGIATSEIGSYSSTVAKKRAVQQMLMNRNKSVISTLTPGETENILYSGCTETWKATPTATIAGLKNGTINGAKIGDGGITAIIAIVSAVVGIIGTIISWFKKDEVPSDATLNSGLFSPTDIKASGSSSGSGSGSFTEAGMSWILPALLVGGVVFSKMQYKNQKSKK